MNRAQRRKPGKPRRPSSADQVTARDVARYAQTAYVQALERAVSRRRAAGAADDTAWTTFPVAVSYVELELLLDLIDRAPRRRFLRRSDHLPASLLPLIRELRQWRHASRTTTAELVHLDASRGPADATAPGDADGAA